jgi:hypothetical protein
MRFPSVTASYLTENGLRAGINPAPTVPDHPKSATILIRLIRAVIYTHLAVTVFSSRKSLMDAILLLAPPKKDLRLEPSGKNAYG